MACRYAIYYSPEKNDSLERFGRAWLGRDAYIGIHVKQPNVSGIPSDRLSEITQSPRKYGFHGTLKPPFVLASGRTVKALFRSVEAFARKQAPFNLPPLKPAVLDGFIALVPEEPCEAMNRLAADCVRFFDPFRTPCTVEEMDRRRAKGLTDSQEAHLIRWGYPHVMSDFRFHLTLTGRLEDASEKEILLAAVSEGFRPFERKQVVVDAISVFHQPAAEDPFQIVRTYPFENIATRFTWR